MEDKPKFPCTECNHLGESTCEHHRGESPCPDCYCLHCKFLECRDCGQSERPDFFEKKELKEKVEPVEEKEENPYRRVRHTSFSYAKTSARMYLT